MLRRPLRVRCMLRDRDGTAQVATRLLKWSLRSLEPGREGRCIQRSRQGGGE